MTAEFWCSLTAPNNLMNVSEEILEHSLVLVKSHMDTNL